MSTTTNRMPDTPAVVAAPSVAATLATEAAWAAVVAAWRTRDAARLAWAAAAVVAGMVPEGHLAARTAETARREADRALDLADAMVAAAEAAYGAARDAEAGGAR